MAFIFRRSNDRKVNRRIALYFTFDIFIYIQGGFFFIYNIALFINALKPIVLILALLLVDFIFTNGIFYYSQSHIKY